MNKQGKPTKQLRFEVTLSKLLKQQGACDNKGTALITRLGSFKSMYPSGRFVGQAECRLTSGKISSTFKKNTRSLSLKAKPIVKLPRLNLKETQTDNFQTEFMDKIDEVSMSWRIGILQDQYKT